MPFLPRLEGLSRFGVRQCSLARLRNEEGGPSSQYGGHNRGKEEEESGTLWSEWVCGCVDIFAYLCSLISNSTVISLRLLVWRWEKSWITLKGKRARPVFSTARTWNPVWTTKTVSRRENMSSLPAGSTQPGGPQQGGTCMLDYTRKGPQKCHSVEWKWDILIMPNISVVLHHRPLRWQAANYSGMPFLMAEQWRRSARFCEPTPQTRWADDILMKWC